jgi:hypothetical protein
MQIVNQAPIYRLATLAVLKKEIGKIHSLRILGCPIDRLTRYL